MVERESGASRLFNILNYVFLAFIGIICLYPFLYVVFASFSDPNQFIKHDFTVLWAPAGFSLEAYKHVFTGELGSGYMNTLIYVVAGTAISMLLTFLGAYVLSRKGYLLKKPLTMVIMFTMYFNGGMIPFYLWINQLGMVDTRWAILLPTALNTYNMIVMRTAFASVPESLIEAAKLDGRLWRIRCAAKALYAFQFPGGQKSEGVYGKLFSGQPGNTARRGPSAL